MKVFLAGTDSSEFVFADKKIDYMLESFYYIRPWQVNRIAEMKMFLLDSGAFTFMRSTKRAKNVNLDNYLSKYIDFINNNDITYFFELDVDSIVGYEKVKEYRKRLETETGKQCIPVWHTSRGREEFLRMCQEYPYVAIGGIVTKEITREQYPCFSWFISEAHKQNCKIHGLGFTDTALLQKYRFDSVDSTSWLNGKKFGKIYYFDNGIMRYKSQPKGEKTVNYKVICDHNIKQWMMYQKYAEINL